MFHKYKRVGRCFFFLATTASEKNLKKLTILPKKKNTLQKKPAKIVVFLQGENLLLDSFCMPAAPFLCGQNEIGCIKYQQPAMPLPLLGLLQLGQTEQG